MSVQREGEQRTTTGQRAGNLTSDGRKARTENRNEQEKQETRNIAYTGANQRGKKAVGKAEELLCILLFRSSSLNMPTTW